MLLRHGIWSGISAGDRNSGGIGRWRVDDTLTVIRKRVDEVNVVFTVTDKRDHFVKDLTQNDFRVFDDSKPALSIQSFNRQTNLPLRVGLLIDASNSVRDRFKFEQEAAIEFLNQIIRPRFDKAFVIGFDTTPEVTQDFSDDAERSPKACACCARAAAPPCMTPSTSPAATS